jgi:hypothetical protein
MKLTDKELIDYTIKFSDDADKIRLATVMERVTGSIIDDLIDAGMDETWCTFRSEWGGEYHPGQYIKLLEDEISHRDFQIKQLHDELEEQKARTIANLIEELNQEIKTKHYLIEEARAESRKAYEEAKHAKEQLKMWNHLRS